MNVEVVINTAGRECISIALSGLLLSTIKPDVHIVLSCKDGKDEEGMERIAPYIKYFKKEYTGDVIVTVIKLEDWDILTAREAGMLGGGKDFTLFLDDDCLLYPETIANMLSFIENTGRDWVAPSKSGSTEDRYREDRATTTCLLINRKQALAVCKEVPDKLRRHFAEGLEDLWLTRSLFGGNLGHTGYHHFTNSEKWYKKQDAESLLAVGGLGVLTPMYEWLRDTGL